MFHTGPVETARVPIAQDVIFQGDRFLSMFLVVGGQRQIDGQPVGLKPQPPAGGLFTLGQRQRDVAEEGGLARAGVAQHDQARLLAQHVFDAQPLRAFRPLPQPGLVQHLARLDGSSPRWGDVQRDVHLGQLQFHLRLGLNDAPEIEAAVGVDQVGHILSPQGA